MADKDIISLLNQKIDNSINHLIAQNDKVAEKLEKISTTLAEQHLTLQIHIKRTNMLEDQIAPISALFQNWNFGWKLGVKILGLAVAVATLAEAVHTLWRR